MVGMSMWEDDGEERGEFRKVGMWRQIVKDLDDHAKGLNCVLNKQSTERFRAVPDLHWKNIPVAVW